jgi:hypothetical protein
MGDDLCAYIDARKRNTNTKVRNGTGGTEGRGRGENFLHSTAPVVERGLMASW